MNNNQWQKIKLKEVCTQITVGYVGSMAKEYVDNGIPFLRSQNILPFKLNLDSSNLKYITPEFHKKIKKSALNSGDIAVVRTGYPGVACVIPKTLKISNCSDLVILRPSEKLDPYYLACVFNSTWGKRMVQGSLVGVAQQHFNVGVAKELEISLPSLPTQQKIAGILSAYDDLIENNTRRIEILEEMARMLYREWFVKFRFPVGDGDNAGEKGGDGGGDRPPNNPPELIESALGLIPKGWEVKTIDEITLEIIDYRGKTPKKLGGDWSDSGIMAISAKNIKQGKLINLHQSKYLDEKLYKKWMKSELQKGDILMTSEAPLGELYYLVEHQKFCLSQRVYSIRANPEIIHPSILYCNLSSTQTQGELTSRQSGTTVVGIRQTELRKIPILIPSLKIQSKAVPILENLFQKINNLDKKNINLRKTRDLLLPRLISGEIDVEDLDINIGD